MCEIQQGTYRLAQAGIISNNLLIERLSKHGYHSYDLTPDLWKYDMNPVTFYLTVYEFSVKYVGKEHLIHLFDAMH